MKLEYLKDVFENKYIGFLFNSIDRDANGISIDDYLDKLADKIGGDYFDMNSNLLARNDNEYHITIFNVQEYSKVVNKYILDDLVTSKINYSDIVFNGIGSISKGDLITYYILVESKQLDKLREDYGFDKRHFHITIAFNKKDLFHLPKNDSTKIINKI